MGSIPATTQGQIRNECFLFLIVYLATMQIFLNTHRHFNSMSSQSPALEHSILWPARFYSKLWANEWHCRLRSSLKNEPRAAGIEPATFQSQVNHFNRQTAINVFDWINNVRVDVEQNLIQLQIRKNDSRQFLFPHQSGDRLGQVTTAIADRPLVDKSIRVDGNNESVNLK